MQEARPAGPLASSGAEASPAFAARVWWEGQAVSEPAQLASRQCMNRFHSVGLRQ